MQKPTYNLGNDGRAYKDYIHKKGHRNRTYGIIKRCKYCGNDFFASDQQIKKRIGQFCSSKCRAKIMMASTFKHGMPILNNRQWILSVGHPNAKFGKRYVQLSRFIMSNHLGRPLKNGEVVHHINGDKHDDRLDNLMLMTKSEHSRLHAIERWSK